MSSENHTSFSLTGILRHHHKRKESELAWKVSAKDVEASGFNLDIKNPNAPEDTIGDPDELLESYKRLVQDVAETRDALKKELGEALMSGR